MMMKLNGRLLLVLAGAATVLGISVHLLHRMQVTRTSKALILQAERAEKEGDLDRAEAFLSRLLALEPANVQGLIRYGRVLERRSTAGPIRERLFQVYERILRFEPSRRDIRRRVAELAMDPKAALYADARHHLEILLHGAPENEQVELTYLIGRCQEESGQLEGNDGAQALYERAAKLEPKRVDVAERLANLLRTQARDPKRADQVMDGLVAASGQSAAAYLARSRYRQKFTIPGATDDVAHALALAPENADVLLAAAKSSLAQGDKGGARGHLRRALELYPRNAELYQNLAELELGDGRTEDAAACLLQGARAVPDDLDLKWTLADVLVQVGKVDDALKVLDELRKAAVRPELLAYLDGRLRMGRGEWSRAIKSFEEARPELAAQRETRELAKRTLLMLAECYDRLGNADQRYTALSQAVAIELVPDPLWVSARLGLASALVGLNKIDEAIEQYRIVLPRQPGASLAIARLQIYQNLYRSAADRPSHWQEVDRILSDLERSAPDSAEVAVLRAEILAAKGELASARALLEKAIARRPDQVDLWVALSGLASREAKPEAALAVLDDAQRRVGDILKLRLARADYWAQQGGALAPKALAQLDQGVEAFSAEDRSRLGHELARAYAQIGDDRQAVRLWTRLAQQQPDDLNVRLILFDHALRAGDESAAERFLEQIRRIEGEEGALWRYGQARLLIRHVDKEPGNLAPLAEARALLSRAATLRPAWSRVPLAEAEIDELEGNPGGAINSYLRAIVSLGERNPLAIRRTVELLNQHQRFDQAVLLIQTLQREGRPISGDLQRLAANISYQTQDYSHALELAEKSVSENSEDYRELLWLGQLRAAAGRPALGALQRAVSLAPEAPETWLALILYLAKTDRKDEAKVALQSAECKLSKEQAPLVLAQGYEAIGNVDQARELFQAALAARPDDIPILRSLAGFHLRSGRLREAEPLLQRIIDIKGATEDVAWARRMLPLIMAAAGDRQRSLKALEVLGLVDATGAVRLSASASPEDLRASARSLALQPSRTRRREAITILEELINRQSASEQDKFLLAQLYEFDRNWEKSHHQMLALVQAHPKEPAYLIYFTLALLRHDRIDEALGYLDKLDQVAPQQPGTIEIKARVFQARHKDTEAVALLKKFASENKSQVGPIARLLEDLGQASAALEMYRTYASQSGRPEATLVLAAFLGRQGRVREALDLCDALWPKTSPELVSNTAVTILYGTKGGDEAQYVRVEKRLQDAIAKAPEKVSIQFDLANLRCLQGRYDEAESILRRLHERGKGQSGPLNNLAWMLAVQGTKQTEALSLINQAIELYGETPDLLDTRALVHLAMGQHEVAAHDLEDAIVAGPSAETYLHLARAYLADGRRSDADEALRRANSSGLKVGTLHPLERKSYDLLVEALTR
ncbi:MAG TPA: tetratricopeptide repeat protein [Isosphaeraceae bacterium]|jgi:tetratricopeptide (TPR) repeat protein|nr:tetratricopeptide repeat protein [Isosphaeraceae bacterium]